MAGPDPDSPFMIPDVERSREAPWDKIAGGFLTLGVALLGINATLGVHPQSAFWTSGLSLTAYALLILAVICFLGYLRQWPMPPIKDRHDPGINEPSLGANVSSPPRVRDTTGAAGFGSSGPKHRRARAARALESVTGASPSPAPVLPDRLAETTDAVAVSLPPTPIVYERRAAPTRESEGRPRQGFVTLWGCRLGGGNLQLPEGLVGVAAIAGGRNYSLVLTESGKVQPYGDLDYHQLPDDLPPIRAIAAGAFHSLAITARSTVVSWHRIDPGELHPFPRASWDRGKSVSPRNYERERRNRERTVTKKYRQRYAVPRGLSEVLAIAAGDLHSLALRRDGIVTAWGDNGNGQCTVPTLLRNVSAIAAGSEHNLALTKTGELFAWGNDAAGQCNVPVWLLNSGVVAIAAGFGHSVALTADGKVTAWGNRDACQVPDDLPSIRAIAAGRGHTLALTEDGTVRAWGANAQQQCDVPADLSGVVAISAGDTHSLALRHPD
jgi:alpha-tubulin suppressor-like RCC1 family protein